MEKITYKKNNMIPSPSSMSKVIDCPLKIISSTNIQVIRRLQFGVKAV